MMYRHVLAALLFFALAPSALVLGQDTPDTPDTQGTAPARDTAGNTAAGESEADPLARLVGAYRFSQSAERGREIVHDAIDRDTDSMNIFLRGIVRGKLEGKNPLISRVEIRVDGDDVVVSLDSITYRAPSSGARVSTHDPDGDDVQISHRVENGKLIQTLYFDGGTRRNVFQLSRGMLQLNVTISSGRLPGPVRYGLRYRTAR